MDADERELLEQIVRQRIGGPLEEALAGLQGRSQELLEALEETAGGLRRSVETGVAAAVAAVAGELEAAAAGRERAATLARGLMRILAAPGQPEALVSLLEGARCFVERSALFVLREGSVSGWRASGFAKPGGWSEEERIRHIRFPLAEHNSLALAIREAEDCLVEPDFGEGDRKLLARLGAPLPAGFVAVPLVIRGRTLAVLYGDNLQGRPPGQEETVLLKALAAATAAAAELHQLRARQAAGKPAGSDGGAGPREAVPAAPVQGEAEGTEPEEQAEHREARRLARLLVSEIKLYNEGKVAVGRKNKDLGQRLQGEIERSRQIYREGVAPAVGAQADYFFEALVSILAGGDRSALGL